MICRHQGVGGYGNTIQQTGARVNGGNPFA